MSKEPIYPPNEMEVLLWTQNAPSSVRDWVIQWIRLNLQLHATEGEPYQTWAYSVYSKLIDRFCITSDEWNLQICSSRTVPPLPPFPSLPHPSHVPNRIPGE